MNEEEANLPSLPEGWEWSSFVDLAANKANALKAGPFGSALKKSSYVSAGFKVYGQEQVIRNDPCYGDYYISEDKFNEFISCSVEPKDILISLVGTIGKVLVLPDDIKPGIINPRLVKLSLDRRITLSEYIKLYIESRSVKKYFSMVSHGGTMEILNLKILKLLPVPTPPLNEQRRIVEKIEALTDRSRKARAALDQIPALLDQFRQSVLAAAFRGDLTADWRAQNPEVESAEALLERIRVERHQRWEEAELEKMKGKGTIPKDAKWKEKYKEPVGLRDTPLTQLPDGWIWANVAQLSNSTLGKMLDKAKHQSGKLLPYLRNVNVRWGSIDTSDVLKMYFEDDEYERYAVKKGDVLICEGGEPGRAAVWEKDEEIKYQKALHRLRPSGGINSYWFVYHLWLDAINGSLEQHYTGSTIKHFTGIALSGYPIRLPSIQE